MKRKHTCPYADRAHWRRSALAAISHNAFVHGVGLLLFMFA